MNRRTQIVIGVSAVLLVLLFISGPFPSSARTDLASLDPLEETLIDPKPNTQVLLSRD
jgi:hypothetical protein